MQGEGKTSTNIPVVETIFLFLSKLKHYEYILNFFLILFLIAPGLMTIAYFREDLLLHLDIFKVILLCLTYSLPFVGLYVFVDSFVNVSTGAARSKVILSKAENIHARISNLKVELGKLTRDKKAVGHTAAELKVIEADSKAIDEQIAVLIEKLPPNYNFYQPLILGALTVMLLTGVFLTFSMLTDLLQTLRQFVLVMLFTGGPLTVSQAVLMNEGGSIRMKVLTHLAAFALITVSSLFVRI